MIRVKQALAFSRSVLLLAFVAACADQPVTPRIAADDESAASAAGAANGRSPRDVPEVRIDLPPAPRPWDTDPAALSQAIFGGSGYAVVAFKEPGSARALATGRRAGVTAGTVRAGLQLLERHGAEVLELLDGIGGARVRISPEAAAEISRHPLIDFVEPRQYGHVENQPIPWNITMVAAPTFWSATGITGAGAKVEIIDTGHQQGHIDLPAVLTANCSGLYGGCNDASTASWHGTHVLGIVAARDNLDGVVGVAPGINNGDVYMYGACDNYGSCPTDEVTAGINAGIFNTHVMNLSLRQPYDASQATAVSQAWGNNIIIVAAAGNNLINTIVYPAAYTNVLGVSGVLSNKNFAGSGTTACGGYSNYGSHVDFAAPFEVQSTIGINTYGTLCGTSMSSPHVTGVAALIRALRPTWTNQQIINLMIANAEDRGTAGKDVYYGYGIVRAIAAPKANITGVSNISTTNSYTWNANPSGGLGAGYTYQWQYRVQGTTTWTNVGTGASTYTRTVAATDADFELRVTVTSGGLTGSDTHLVDVGVPPVYAEITGPIYMMSGETGTWVSNASGGTGAYTYQWQFRLASSTSWTDVGTSSTYTRNAPFASFYLRVTGVSGGVSYTSTEHFVTVEREVIEPCYTDGGGRVICQ